MLLKANSRYLHELLQSIRLIVTINHRAQIHCSKLMLNMQMKQVMQQAQVMKTLLRWQPGNKRGDKCTSRKREKKILTHKTQLSQFMSTHFFLTVSCLRRFVSAAARSFFEEVNVGSYLRTHTGERRNSRRRPQAR